MRERWTWVAWFMAGALLMGSALFGVYQIPWVKYRLEWRLDAAAGVVAGWLHPGETLPTPVHSAATPVILANPDATSTRSPLAATGMPAPTPVPLAEAVSLPAPEWEKQDWNNCGPATLALAMRYFGWEGDQYDISDLLKPDRADKNVNVEELAYYVRTRAGWLNAEYRVAGYLETLKRFLAAGYPVVVEKSFVMAETEGGGWAAHYVLLTGYNDATRQFVTQDSYHGANLSVSYDDLEECWRAFNHVYMVVFPAEDSEVIAGLLGDESDLDVNRERALERSQAEVATHDEDASAWFNLGSNLVYFERYAEAAQAFDTALSLGLPWRFTRYQFGPYLAYFHQGRYEDLIDLTTATLYRTSKSEEAMLWRGWARFGMGDTWGALEDFNAALEINPNYLDAQYAVDFVSGG
ncbi:MAG: C39 family peptidase [Chloroflexi bacterium]|nr:C39 family peptidase [Chloroflexota bacterium]